MWIRKSFHFAWNLLIVAEFFVKASLIKLFAAKKVKQQLLIQNTRQIARKFIQAFHIKLRIKNPERLSQLRDQNYLVVGNHSAYLDIFMLAAQEDYVFITSVEMRESPFLGDVTRAAGCLFTDRKRKVSLPQEISRFTQTIRSGFKVVLFPEKPHTDGSGVLEFRKSLFQVAVDSCCTVLPVCIRYLRLDGDPVTAENRYNISWYGGINFIKHLWNLMARRLEAEISFLDPIEYDPERKRGELSDLVYARVSDTFHSYDVHLAEPI